MAKDTKSIIASALDDATLHGLMAKQTDGLTKVTEEITKLFSTYGCADFNSAYSAFEKNPQVEKEFKKKRDALIEQLKQIAATMDAIKEAQSGE